MCSELAESVSGPPAKRRKWTGANSDIQVMSWSFLVHKAVTGPAECIALWVLKNSFFCTNGPKSGDRKCPPGTRTFPRVLRG